MFAVCGAESDRNGIFSFQSVYEAYALCRRRKRNTINALKFEIDLLEAITDLSESLADGSYRPSPSVRFVVKDPKYREVFAADFRDRVVHHLLVPRLERVFEPKCIFDSYACRKGKGTHAAVKRLKRFMRQITGAGKGQGYYLQLDIKSFFINIDRSVLFELIRKKVENGILIALTQTILFQDCRKDYVYRGDPGLMRRVPAHKSLLHAEGNKGIPIGNLTSQFFANLYLNELDQFVKHRLRCRHYIRYMDDCILLERSPSQLGVWQQRIEQFLKNRLELELKPGWRIASVYRGIDFLGYVTRPDYTLIRNRVIGNLKSRLCQFRREIVSERANGGRSILRLNLQAEIVGRLRQVLMSYLGHFRHASHYRAMRRIWERFGYLDDIFWSNAMPAGKLESKLEPPYEPLNLRSQYLWFTDRYRGACIFFQIGKYCEFHFEEAVRYGGLFRLTIREGKRFPGKQCGFPKGYLEHYRRLAMGMGMDTVVVQQAGRYANGLQRRAVVSISRVRKTGTAGLAPIVAPQ